MKCPKCGYHSFDHLENCKKCGVDLTAHKSKYNLRGFYAPGQMAMAGAADVEEPMAEPITAAAQTAGSEVDFGFDFLDEDDEPQAGGDQDLNLEKPFDIDAETVPADNPDGEGKKNPGSEFSF